MITLVCTRGDASLFLTLSEDSRDRFKEGKASVMADPASAFSRDSLSAAVYELAGTAASRESILVVNRDGERLHYVELL